MQVPDQGPQAFRVPIAPPFNPVFVLPIEPKPSQFAACPLPLPPSSAWVGSRSRRVFDFSIALAILMLLGVPMLLIAASVRMTSTGPAFFVQRRVGRRGRLFGIYKFRSMEEGSSAGPGLTRGGDSRVTSIGRWIRKFKARAPSCLSMNPSPTCHIDRASPAPPLSPFATKKKSCVQFTPASLTISTLRKSSR